jgi:Dolichyl-phosphate-mannose-protein mannosyltransferase
LSLVLLVWVGAQSFFGTIAASFSTVLLVFEPNILAHGALLTTDMALALSLLSATLALYWYFEAPNGWRLMVLGLALGLTFVRKFSGVLIVPIVIALVTSEFLRLTNRERGAKDWRLPLLQTAGHLAHLTFEKGRWFYFPLVLPTPNSSSLNLRPPAAVKARLIRVRTLTLIGISSKWEISIPTGYKGQCSRNTRDGYTGIRTSLRKL